MLTALSDIFDSNARVESIIADESADDVAEGISELHSTLDTATKSLNKGNFTDIVIFNYKPCNKHTSSKTIKSL